MKFNAVRAMIIISLMIIILYVMGLFLPIIKNTKESRIENFINTTSNINILKKKNIIVKKWKNLLTTK